MQRGEFRRLSPITSGLEHLFAWFQYISPATLLFGVRLVKGHQEFESSPEDLARAIRRSRQVEGYLLVWLLVESGAAVLAARASVWQIAVAVCGFRIFDIMQAAANMHVFDRLRFDEPQIHVAMFARILILSVWNYFEIFFCFGTIYAARRWELHQAQGWFDPYYFSITTQLTIGYGDITPLGILKMVAAMQGALGFLFGLVVLSRFVAFLPRPRSVARDE